MRSRCDDRYNASVTAARMPAPYIIGVWGRPPHGKPHALNTYHKNAHKQTHRGERCLGHDRWLATRSISADSHVTHSHVTHSHVPHSHMTA